MAAEDSQALQGAGPAGGEEVPPLAGPAASREFAVRLGPTPAFHAPAPAQPSQALFRKRDSWGYRASLSATSSLVEGQCFRCKRGASLSEIRGTTLRPGQPGTTSWSTAFPDWPHWRSLPLKGFEYWRRFRYEQLKRHFRCLLPRRRPLGPKGATLLALSSPPTWGSRCRGSATQRERAVVTCSAYWITMISWPYATPSQTA